MIKRFLLSTCLFLAPLSAFATWPTDRDASAGYTPITVLASAVDEAVPFCIVYLSDMPADFHTAMTAASDTDGKTIRVSTSDGSTQLACYPVGVDTGTDTGALFFLGTGMSASVDVSYRIYVGNAALSMESVSGGMGRNTVFAAYAGFYLPGMSVTDLTGGGRDLTAVNTPTTDTSGYEGITAAKYNGTNQYHKYDGTQAVTNWPVTIEALGYSTSTTTDQSFLSLCSTSNNFPHAGAIVTNANKASGYFRGDSGAAGQATTTGSIGANTWVSIAANRDANTGTSRIYLGGSASGTSTTTIVAPTFDRLAIGGWARGTPLWYLSGRVAMAALSSSVRSANFLATQKQNWDGAIYSVGSWTAASSCTSGSTGWVLMLTDGQTTTADADFATTSNALVDDANAATVTLDDVTNLYSETLKLTNPAYGTTIPTTAGSYTVSIRVKRSAQTTSGKVIHDKVVKFIDNTGALVGTNLADTSTTWPSTATTKDYTVTGVTYTGSEFTSSAGVAIQADGSVTNGNTTTNIQAVWIKVDWSCGTAADRARGFFVLSGG